MSGFFISKVQAADESDAVAALDEEDVVDDTEEAETETVEEVAPTEEETSTPQTPTEEAVVPESETAEVANSEEEKTEESAPTVEEKKEISVWQTEGDKATTTGPVEVGVKYEAPQNKEVTVTFTKLPSTPGTLTIEEITLTKEQIAQTGSLSDKAYDITSTMENGSFEYELTLPIPEGKENVQVKYADDVEGLKEAETVKADDVKTEGDSVKVELDHFTIFITSLENLFLNLPDTTFDPGETVLMSANGLENGKYYNLYVIEPDGTTNHLAGICYHKTGSNDDLILGLYTLANDAPNGTWQAVVKKYNGLPNCLSDTSAQLVQTADFTVGAVCSSGIYLNDTCKPTIQVAVNDAVSGVGDIIEIRSNITHTDAVVLNKTLTIKGVGGSVLTTSGGNQLFTIVANGVTIEDLVFNKTDKTSQHFIGVQSSNVTIRNNTFAGQYVLGEGDVARAIVVSGGLTDLVITGNSFTALRQPAYINNDSSGTISDNFVGGTRGWVVEKASNFAFTGNSWGTNAVDIAIIPGVNPAATVNNYTCQIPAIKTANNNANIEDQYPSAIPCPDAEAPSVPVIINPIAEQVFATQPILNQWTVSTDNVGVDHYQVAYRYDDGHTFGGSTCPGEIIGGNAVSGCRDEVGTSRNHTPALSEQGGVTIYVRAFDAAGNASAWSAPVHYYYNTDITPPAVPVHESPADNASINYNDFYFQWTDVADAVEYEFQSSQNPAVDGNGVLTSGVWNNKIHGAPDRNNLTASEIHSYGANGTWYWQVRAKDAAGNWSAWTSPWKLTIDMVAPSAPSLVSPANNAIVHGGSVTQSWTHSNLSDVHHYIYESYHDAGATNLRWHEELAGTSKTATNVADATYWWRVKAVDAAGNVSGWSPLWKLTIDSTAPVVAFTNPTNGSINNGPVELRATVTDAHPHHYWLQIKKNGSVMNIPGVTGTKNTTVSFTDKLLTTLSDDGTYEITLAARDAVGGGSSTGNRSADVVINFVVDTTVPSSTITTFGLADGGTVETPIWDGVVAGTATDGSGSGINRVDLEITYTPFGGGTPVISNVTATGTTSWSYDLGDPAEGTYQVVSHAVDNAGNVESTYTITIVYDKTIPEVSLTIDPTNPNGDNNWYVSKPVITLTANDNYNVDYIEYQFNGTGGAWTTYTGPVTITDGTWQFYYRSVDTVGNVSGIGLKNVKVDTQDPDEVSGLDAEYREQQDDIKLDWNADDNDIDKVYIYRGGSRNFNINSGNKVAENDDNDETYSDNNPDFGETYYYKLVSVDEAGNRSGARVIKVEMPENEGGTATVTDEGTDADGGEVLGVETANTEEGNSTQGGEVAEDGSVLGATDENGATNGIMDFIKKYSWWWLIILLLIGYTGYRYYVSKKQNHLV